MAISEYTIRLAELDEVMRMPEIECAAAKLFRETPYDYLVDSEPHSLEFYKARQQENLLWVVVDCENHPVGFAAVRILDDEVYLHELDVVPEHGRKGLGTRLIFAVGDWANSAGFSAITLSTFMDVAWNAPFYEKLGFRILGDDELTEPFKTIRREEAENQLPLDKRVLMRWNF
ncbi:MAG: GNAT family N-acetyltransferase [Acidobacteriota bacterium]